MYCSACGKEIRDDSEFCVHCGAKANPAAAQAGSQGPPPAPPGPPGPPSYVPPPGAPSAGGAAQRKRSALPWVLGVIGLIAVVAVVLVLVFVVFGGGESETSGTEKVVEDSNTETSSPEKVVRDFYRVFEEKDADLLLSLMEPSFADELKEALGKDYKKLLDEYFFPAIPEGVKFDIRKMDTKIEGDKATVSILEGTLTYIDENGEKVSEEASGGDETAAFELVKVKGKWYISGDYMREAGLDPSELEQLEELE